MENAMVLLYDICRICLDEPGANNIFQPTDWSHDIFTYTGVKVSATDKMPQTICTSCQDIITCVKVLKDVAQANARRLQAICGNDNTGDDQNESLYPQEIPNSTVKKSGKRKKEEVRNSFRNRLVFESDLPELSETKEYDRKRKSSTKSENEGSAPKLAVRKDLFDSTEQTTETVSSSSAKIVSSPSKEAEVNDKADETEVGSSKTSSTRKSSSPTPTSSKVSGSSAKTEGEHLCETCNKIYATAKKLYLHQLAHNKKFICPLDACGKKFATNGDLKKHIRSHTGEKPFKCNQCDQSFSQNVTLKLHKVNVHNESKSQR